MTKEEIISNAITDVANKYVPFPYSFWNVDRVEEVASQSAIEYAKPYKEIADLISRIFHYCNFKPETINERLLEQKLIEVGLWPTTEDEIINRPNLHH